MEELFYRKIILQLDTLLQFEHHQQFCGNHISHSWEQKTAHLLAIIQTK